MRKSKKKTGNEKKAEEGEDVRENNERKKKTERITGKEKKKEKRKRERREGETRGFIGEQKRPRSIGVTGIPGRYPRPVVYTFPGLRGVPVAQYFLET